MLCKKTLRLFVFRGCIFCRKKKLHPKSDNAGAVSMQASLFIF